MCFTGFAELGEDAGAGDAAMRGDRQGVAGVVVELAQDLHVGVIGQPPVGEVGLPALIRLLGGKTDVGRLGPFLRGRGDQPGRGQMPVYRIHRHNQAVVVAQVPGDRVRPIVEAFASERLAEPDDQVDRGLRQPGVCATGPVNPPSRWGQWWLPMTHQTR
jgi:hypothetical protein